MTSIMQQLQDTKAHAAPPQFLTGMSRDLETMAGGFDTVSANVSRALDSTSL